ncbi:MAG: peptidoglycan DD-metalloendopeptidase family protein [Deltaproteobacteria bacterium]|nr:peptidoglycan DD-metalloendopeptidase family protein [Deltaproteobacteria bacterium]
MVPNPVDRGSPGRVILSGVGLEAGPRGSFDGKPVFFFETAEGLTGIFGADIMIALGAHPLEVSWKGDSPGRLAAEVTVKDKDYGTRTITVPKSQVELSREDQERAAREKVLTDRALSRVSPARLWRGAWLEPVDAAINSSFGRKTRMNGILNPRPHAGADYRAPEGAPVRAPADGVVILAGSHFFAGNSIYIDHGQGLVSMYFHLSEILVSEGQTLRKGDGPIGKVGRTGRVTGAHLHYGVYLNGARIDPSAFRKLTSTLRETAPARGEAGAGVQAGSGELPE